MVSPEIFYGQGALRLDLNSVFLHELSLSVRNHSHHSFVISSRKLFWGCLKAVAIIFAQKSGKLF